MADGLSEPDVDVNNMIFFSKEFFTMNSLKELLNDDNNDTTESINTFQRYDDQNSSEERHHRDFFPLKSAWKTIVVNPSGANTWSGSMNFSCLCNSMHRNPNKPSYDTARSDHVIERKKRHFVRDAIIKVKKKINDHHKMLNHENQTFKQQYFVF